VDVAIGVVVGIEVAVGTGVFVLVGDKVAVGSGFKVGVVVGILLVGIGIVAQAARKASKKNRTSLCITVLARR
jgi:hypothetical protein